MGYKIYCYVIFYGYANFCIAFKLYFGEGGGTASGKESQNAWFR